MQNFLPLPLYIRKTCLAIFTYAEYLASEVNKFPRQRDPLQHALMSMSWYHVSHIILASEGCTLSACKYKIFILASGKYTITDYPENNESEELLYFISVHHAAVTVQFV